MSLKSSPDSQTAAQDLPVGLTPELMQWVRDQRASGIGPAALLRSMRDVGWSEELARRALDLPEQGEVSPPAVVVSASSLDRKSTRLNSSHLVISYAVFCLK